MAPYRLRRVRSSPAPRIAEIAPGAGTAGGPGTNFYAGFQFNIGVATHYGCILFSIPSSSSPFTGATAVAAAWQNTAGLGINAGAVPAPGAIAAILGAGLLRTRRRR
ncbi:MAG: hypothetical protein ACKOFI_08550 [Phycisphaerales bacterium]